MLILFDIGNTHTHLGLANRKRVVRHSQFPTAAWFDNSALRKLRRFLAGAQLEGVALCSVVPRATRKAIGAARQLWKITPLQLRPDNVVGIGIDYPNPATIGPDRLANAVAVHHHYGAPAVVVDFGTAVTFDVVDRRANYAGGIIAPGLAAMTHYLHEKTALLPQIRIREIKTSIGRTTEQAMLIGAVHGYRGLVRELLKELRSALRRPRLPIVATGGYAQLLALRLPEITAVEPLLTLEGVRLVWQGHHNR